MSQTSVIIDNSEIEKELKTIKQTLKSFESENQSLKNQIKQLDDDLTELKGKEIRLRDQLKKTQDELANKFNRFESENYENAKKQLDELQVIVNSQRDENEDLHDEIEKLKGDNNRMASLERFYKDEISKLQKNNKDKLQQIKDIESQLEQLHVEKLELSKLKIEQDGLIVQLKTNQNENANSKKLKEIIESQTEEIEELAQELEASKQVYGTLVTLLKFKNTEIEHYKN